MILPTKHLSTEKSLLWIGAEILDMLNEPKTVSRLWNDFRLSRNNNQSTPKVTYEWFILALDLLYTTDAIQYSNGRISKLEL
jgi:hypothetical protein